MPYLLDTNIAIYVRDGNAQVLNHLAAHPGAVVLSALSLAKLQPGLFKDPAYTAKRQDRLNRMLADIPILPFDAAAALAYGRIIALCGWVRGRDFNRMIAAHAIATAATLVTNNFTNFRDIPNLTLENWTI